MNVSRVRVLRSEWRHPPQACNWTHRWITIPLLLLILVVVICFSLTTICLSLDKGLFCTASSTSTTTVESSKTIQWSEWTLCKTSFSCSVGDRFRISTILNKDPTLPTIKTMQFNWCNDSNDCPQRGWWAHWMEWSSCTETCGPFGLLVRQRQCLAPQNVATLITNCDGLFYEVKNCSNTVHCTKADKHFWLEWSGWSSCSVTCAPPQGLRKRTRSCANRKTGAQVSDTTNCPGVSNEEQNCLHSPTCPAPPTAATPVVFTWAPWTSWSSCSVTCSPPTGQMKRTQECRKQTVAINSAAKNECRAGAANSEDLACLGSSPCRTLAP